jgi:hypothetical protein
MLESPSPFIRNPDKSHAPIGGVGHPGHQTQLLEAVDNASDAGRMSHKQITQLAQGDFADPAEIQIALQLMAGHAPLERAEERGGVLTDDSLHPENAERRPQRGSTLPS